MGTYRAKEARKDRAGVADQQCVGPQLDRAEEGLLLFARTRGARQKDAPACRGKAQHADAVLWNGVERIRTNGCELDGADGCAFCRRPLRDPVSKLVGYGPDCAEHNGLPHQPFETLAQVVRVLRGSRAGGQVEVRLVQADRVAYRRVERRAKPW